MTNVGLRFREWLSGPLQVVQDELDQIIAGIQGTWAIQHTADGTHGTITAADVTCDSIVLNKGTIRFPVAQQPSSNANTLDDYEEGTWTPVLGGEGGTSGQTYGTQVGRYVKVGRLVTAWFHVTLTAKGTITGNAQIRGIPFAADTNSRGTAEVVFSSLATTWVNVNAALIGSSSTTAAFLYGNTAAATANNTNLATADINDTTQIAGVLTYLAAQ